MIYYVFLSSCYSQLETKKEQVVRKFLIISGTIMLIFLLCTLWLRLNALFICLLNLTMLFLIYLFYIFNIDKSIESLPIQSNFIYWVYIICSLIFICCNIYGYYYKYKDKDRVAFLNCLVDYHYDKRKSKLSALLDSINALNNPLEIGKECKHVNAMWKEFYKTQTPIPSTNELNIGISIREDLNYQTMSRGEFMEYFNIKTYAYKDGNLYFQRYKEIFFFMDPQLIGWYVWFNPSMLGDKTLNALQYKRVNEMFSKIKNDKGQNITYIWMLQDIKNNFNKFITANDDITLKNLIIYENNIGLKPYFRLSHLIKVMQKVNYDKFIQKNHNMLKNIFHKDNIDTLGLIREILTTSIENHREVYDALLIYENDNDVPYIYRLSHIVGVHIPNVHYEIYEFDNQQWNDEYIEYKGNDFIEHLANSKNITLSN